MPGGLIHHWIAAAFLPSVKLDDILEVTEDYDRYQEVYRPSVIASKTVARENSTDYFSMQLMNKAFFLKTTLDADYQATNVRLDDRHFYSVSRSTRVQEIEDHGRLSQRRLPEGQGGGYIWKLFSIVRLDQRDGGVYIELEAIVLSRDIPGAMRFVVDPIVRSVSRNALLTSMLQTEEAVCGRFADVARSAGTAPGSEPEGVSAAPSISPSRLQAFIDSADWEAMHDTGDEMFRRKFVITWFVGMVSTALPAFSQSGTRRIHCNPKPNGSLASFQTTGLLQAFRTTSP